ncbi:MAG: hypothetical protein ACJZZ7_00815 [Cytophagales bacterium]|nr:MAG: hypothetical protein CNE34_04070 [Rhodothermaeota bacterium MED-G18]|tara:strand:+ start:4002 stop:4223 length:222 start_codon:yes stop_codon:yes gene_type:complete
MSKTSTNNDIIKNIYRELEENKEKQFKINLLTDLEVNSELEVILSEIYKIELFPSEQTLKKVMVYSKSKKIVN